MTNQVQVGQVNSTTGVVSSTTTSATGAATVVTFVYHVKDSKKDYVNVTTTTSLATGVDRKLLGDGDHPFHLPLPEQDSRCRGV